MSGFIARARAMATLLLAAGKLSRVVTRPVGDPLAPAVPAPANRIPRREDQRAAVPRGCFPGAVR